MYGLPDSAIYGTYKVMKSKMKSAKRADQSEVNQEFLFIPFWALGKLFDLIGFIAESIGTFAERLDRKMRAKRARQMLDAEKKVS
jgi:hypothetical protein